MRYSYHVIVMKVGATCMECKDFPLRLAQLRMRRGVSARDMSLSMGQNPGYVNNIETGKTLPSLEGVFFICDYLGLSPSQFFDMETEDPWLLSSVLSDLKRLNAKQLEHIAAVIQDVLD